MTVEAFTLEGYHGPRPRMRYGRGRGGLGILPRGSACKEWGHGPSGALRCMRYRVPKDWQLLYRSVPERPGWKPLQRYSRKRLTPSEVRTAVREQRGRGWYLERGVSGLGKVCERFKTVTIKSGPQKGKRVKRCASFGGSSTGGSMASLGRAGNGRRGKRRCVQKYRSGPKAGKCKKFAKVGRAAAKKATGGRKKKGSLKGRKCVQRYGSGPKKGRCKKYSK